MIMVTVIAGLYLVGDALASLVKFRQQPAFYQAVRVGRLAIGLMFIVLATR